MFFVEVDPALYGDSRGSRCDGVIPNDGGVFSPGDTAHGGSDGALFGESAGSGGEGFRQLSELGDAVGPGVGVGFVHENGAGRCAHQLFSRPLVGDSGQLAVRGIEFQFHAVVFDGGIGADEGSFVSVHIAFKVHPVDTVAESGNFGDESGFPLVVPSVGSGGADSLDCHGIAVAVDDPLRIVVDAHKVFHRPRMGVEHHHGRADAFRVPCRTPSALCRTGIAVPDGVDVPGNLLKGEIDVPVSNGLGFAVLDCRVIVGFPDTASAENVVELIEQGVLPAAFQIGGGIGRAHEMTGENRVLLCRDQGVFALPVVLLDHGAGAVASLCVELQISLHGMSGGD